VAIVVQDYLIDQSDIDWQNALAGWAWLLPTQFTLWLVSRFCDMFLVLPDGTVHMLDVGAGTLTKFAESRDDFCRQIDEGENADDWLMIPLVDQLVAAGMILRPGQCYSLKLPPVLGGQYTVENCGVLAIRDYLGGYGSIHNQLRDVPEVAEVRLNVINKQG
jgi:hypothetical protein